jgi:hypothetical protein
MEDTLVRGGLHEWRATGLPPRSSRSAAVPLRPIKVLVFSTPVRLSVEDTLFKRQAQDLRDVTSGLREFTHEENATMRQRYRHPSISPIAEMVWCGARQGMGSVMSCRAPLHLVMRSAAVQRKDNVNHPHAVL